ncbi:DUF4292 domain-containing protein [Zhouia spongiae]|uniref:DUF4292 domain-containing protein n=1 Tax=Zhouia spongiae TaxID=2202721 RepID=A0ABY3YPC3_9FLAO|nr:DUF4292 domain-containing protein [Zhouia spongiae]UNY99676.1 DUF4292 domain-containing protein [Zhouia spongiae]
MKLKIKKYIAFLFLPVAITMQSCGSKKAMVSTDAIEGLSARTIIKNHYKNELDFNTIRGRIKIGFENQETSMSNSVTLRMEKDKAIWLSATLGVVKVYITPDRVSFYNKLDNTYFDGDFSYLSQLLGTSLDFQKVQNMLLGQALFDLKNEKYDAAVVQNKYQLKPRQDITLFEKLFLIDPLNFKMAVQRLTQSANNRMLMIAYDKYDQIGGRPFPGQITILANEGSNQTKIDLEYKNIEFNQKVSFPYKIPKGFKQLTVK